MRLTSLCTLAALALLGGVTQAPASGAADGGVIDGFLRKLIGPLRYERFGEGVPGAGGIVPTLTGNGTHPDAAGYSIHLDQGVGGGRGVLFLGTARHHGVPFAAGDLFLAPESLFCVMPLQLSGSPGQPGEGRWHASGVDLRGISVNELVLQAALLDQQAEQGVALSNALAIVLP